ncbi:hypothetical protein IPM65_03340 [Candidatus Roizmanbacteria bacterium]|nr:MAG: hypothetical protein IPM65_03340 [Candidatus Roizmanbacteria bacterium]
MKKGPLILLGVLITILFFILGMQFGKRVQTADEALQLLLTIAPSPSILPVTQKPIPSFRLFDSTTCGFSMLYPESLSTKKISSNSGAFIDETSNSVMSFTCNEEMPVVSEATSSVTLDDVDGIEYLSNDTNTIRIEHPTRETTLSITFEIAYRTLVERTFIFTE